MSQGPRSYSDDFQSDRRSLESSIHHRNDGGPQTVRNHRKVKRVLNQAHIFLITISGVIGVGLFGNSGEVLRIAGPLGGITAFILVGFFVICVMEGLAEMLGHWPIANSMFEFVAKFVDKELAIVIGIAYWYCYAIGFATLILVAADLATFWEWSTTLQDLIFTVGLMVLMLCINCIGVLAYARVESGLGILKIILVIGAFFTMLGINQKDVNANTSTGRVGETYIDDGYQHNPNVASNNFIAVIVVIPIVAYAFCGVEIVAVTALEAKSQQALKFPAKWIAYLTTGTYVISVIAFYLNTSWLDPALPILLGRKNGTITDTRLNSTLQSASNSTTLRTSAIIIISTCRVNVPGLPDILNFGLIIAVLSTANTSLYVASRTLYGLTQGVNPKDKIWGWLSIFSRTTPQTNIPAFALFASATAFCWVPFLRFSKSLTNKELQEIMVGIATVGVVTVWAALCFAFIRYRKWLKKHEGQLENRYSEYNYWKIKNDSVPFRTVLGGLQPVPAWIGLISCLLIITIFASASWWNGKEKFAAVAAAYAGPTILGIVLIVLKYFRRRGNSGWVTLGTWEELEDTLDTLAASRDDKDDEDDNSVHGHAKQSIQGHQSTGKMSGWFSRLPDLSLWSGWTMPGKGVFSKLPGSRSDDHQNVIRSVSPGSRSTMQFKATHKIEEHELNESPMFPPTAAQPQTYDQRRSSYNSLSVPRKPVPGFRSSISEQGESSERLLSPVDTGMTPAGTPRSHSLAGSRSPMACPRTSNHTLVPPGMHDYTARSYSSSSQPAVVDERDLETQDDLRRDIWAGQLTPQSPPAMSSSFDPLYDASEPGTGVHDQRLHRTPVSVTGLRSEFERGAPGSE